MLVNSQLIWGFGNGILISDSMCGGILLYLGTGTFPMINSNLLNRLATHLEYCAGKPQTWRLR